MNGGLLRKKFLNMFLSEYILVILEKNKLFFETKKIILK